VRPFVVSEPKSDSDPDSDPDPDPDSDTGSGSGPGSDSDFDAWTSSKQIALHLRRFSSGSLASQRGEGRAAR
jgi:hypothetical protein